MIDKSMFDRFVGANYSHVADEINVLAQQLEITVTPWPESVPMGTQEGSVLALLDDDIRQIIVRFEFPE